ncbi:MAG: 1-acyl-sn-glycerol-3-phosphate acyltransferase [Deltaproteobacteria bacterium]|nr:1-acyl-sn-glycerol-3-phosphate acyltransferase [Deltaproteobacteria bacterium]
MKSLRPSLDLLSPMERFAIRVGEITNESEPLKRALTRYQRTFGAWWVHEASKKAIDIRGLDRVRAVAPSRGVIVASNHRSFFDMYVTSSILYRNVDWVDRLFFPVRSEFFYEGLTGLFVNAVIGGFAMYPPVFRSGEKRELNNHFLSRTVAFLQRRGTVVGIHPEGTRGKGPDPYALLPAQPGAGRMIHAARVPVIPVWTLGLTNNFLHQVIRGVAGHAAPVTVVFGAPVYLDDFLAETGRPAIYKRVADRVLDAIRALANSTRNLSPVNEVPRAPAASANS